MPEQVSICVIGSGYVGLVAAACFADMGHNVVCVDNDEARVKQLCEGGVPIFEEHLPELLQKHRGSKVVFTSNLAEAVEKSEAVFIAVGTPQGDGGAADLSYVEAVVAEIARAIKSYKVIVEKSTVPVYTNDWIRRVLHRHGVDAGTIRCCVEPRVSARRHGGRRFSAPRPHCRGRRQRPSGDRCFGGSMSHSPAAATTRSPAPWQERAAQRILRDCW